MKTIFTKVVIATVICGVLMPSTCLAQSASPAPQIPDARLREFEEFVRVQMERDRIPGMTIGFFKDDFKWVKGFGYADVENKIPAQADSAYRIASTTKPMTGAAVVQLAERGKINLDAEIQTYLPDYAKQQWPVTVRQLLTHLGGGQGPSGLGPEHVSMKELVGRLSKSPITIEPGTRFIYGTGAYNLLAAAIENVSGMSFEKYLRENLWLPAGMRDTRIDDVRDLVPNRVRGYDLADGELKNAPFINVSSRIGGGGVTSTAPDLLRWARAVIDQKILSERWHAEMLTPVATRAGRWAGIFDGQEYYTLGWMIRPINGNYVLNHGGSQKGTEAAFFVFPEKRLAITILCNLEFAPLEKYLRRLFEMITEEEWDARIFTKSRLDAAIAQALDSSFNYGSLHFWQNHRPMVTDGRELNEAFSYFNSNVSRAALRSANATAPQKIRDGRHPIGGNAFIKVGSFMASTLVAKNGKASFANYHTLGAIRFFADYIRLYKSDRQIAPELRFSPEFERIIERWDADWTRTWNATTRSLTITAHSDLAKLGVDLRREFANSEVYPDFTVDLQRIQQGEMALTANKLGVDLYPHSDELLFNLGYFLIITEQTEQGREAARRLLGSYERPAVYFRRAFEANPSGVMAAATFLDLGRRWLRRPEMHVAAIELVMAGIDLHPSQAPLHELLGDLLLKRGQMDQATAKFRKAYELDPKIGKGATLDEYIDARLKLK